MAVGRYSRFGKVSLPGVVRIKDFAPSGETAWVFKWSHFLPLARSLPVVSYM